MNMELNKQRETLSTNQCIYKLECLRIYLKMKIEVGLKMEFEEWLNRIRYYGSESNRYYTFEKYWNWNTFNSSTHTCYLEKTTKLWN